MINGPIPYSADGDFVMGRDARARQSVRRDRLSLRHRGGRRRRRDDGRVDRRGPAEPRSLAARRAPLRRPSRHSRRSCIRAPSSTTRITTRCASPARAALPRAASGSARCTTTLAAKGAVFGSSNGWERPNWFAPAGVEPVDRAAFENPNWEPFVAEEHRAVRMRVALIDQTSFSKFELRGPGALDALQRLAVSNMDEAGRQRRLYPALQRTRWHRGRPDRDADRRGRLLHRHRLAASASTTPIGSRATCRTTASAVLTEVTAATCGDQSVRPRSPAASSKRWRMPQSTTRSFPFATARRLNIGSAPILAIRIGYGGELGWELHVPTEFARQLYETLWSGRRGRTTSSTSATGRSRRCAWRRATSTGAPTWTPDYDPIEAGLGGRVHLKSKGGFIGRTALERAKAEPPARRPLDLHRRRQGSRCSAASRSCIDEARSSAWRPASGYGPTVGKTILMGYLPAELARARARSRSKHSARAMWRGASTARSTTRPGARLKS